MKQVLLIDDDPTQLHIRELLLRGAGFTVCIATNAESALALMRTLGSGVGLIITDHILPGAQGNVFVRQLREFMPDVPVVVLSGMAEAEDDYRGLNVAFRHKPFPPSDLIALVEKALGPASSP